MRLDVTEFGSFYDSALGAVTRRVLRRRLRAIWPDVRGLNILGLGYATPYLSLFHEEATRVIALMPAQQGVARWPRQRPSAVALCDDTELPLPDASIDRLILIHEMEMTTEMRPFLRELWRVLQPGGRMLAVVPNRRGVWTRTERTPFGYGRAFGVSEIERTLCEALFEPLRTEYLLHVPPTRWRFLLKTWPFWESAGPRLWPAFSGLLVAEAAKTLYAPTGGVKVRRTIKMRVPEKVLGLTRQRGLARQLEKTVE